jgi:hypothetical protein
MIEGGCKPRVNHELLESDKARGKVRIARHSNDSVEEKPIPDKRLRF